MRVAWVALALSVGLHLALLGVPPWPVFPEVDIALPPLEARLVERGAAVPEAPAPVRKPAPPAPLRTAPPSAPPAAPSPALDTAPVADALPVAPPPVAPIETDPGPEPIADALPAPPLNPLPPRLDLRFTVHYGVASGEQTLVWVREGEAYTLTSVASASGLAGLFYRGQLVQTSRGRVTPQGLVPEEFWDQRGERRSLARIDVAAGRLTLSPAQGAPRHFTVTGPVQDALSLFFQLALTAPPPDRVAYTVFNGKKLRDYVYDVRGEETLETALGPLRTLHLVRVGNDAGRFEAWLAIDRHYLPVRVLRGDDDGRVAELRIRAIAP